ncbi:uncharacterized protein LOC129753650 [Uranotaenia lowii]|uniref:uncharacterized protein LOC129753650 n=1 Tax=Uranotaenia lowii TaxID=190385 RepID=UPI002478CB2A|nr:uncharacterized protein LOC129753650 [Uranotaenia lowii]
MPIGADPIKSKARLLKRNSILTSFTVICRFVENYDENGSELHKLVDTFERTVKVLKQLGEPTEQWDTLLIHLLTHRLDKKTHRDWEKFCADKDDETTDMLISFLHRKVNVLQAVIEAGNNDVTITKKPQTTDAQRAAFEEECPLSTGPSRGIAESSSYRPRPPPNHNSSQASVAVSSEPVSLSAISHTDTRVLLASAVVLLITKNGVEIPVRALLDSGSECHFATERLHQLLNLRGERVNLPILGIGQTNTHVRSKIRAKLRSRICNFEAAIEMLVLPKVTMDLPGVSLSPNNWNIPPSIQLADPSFHDSNPVDLIIGAEIFFHVFAVPGKISLGEGLPLLINSRLGWVVSGRATDSTTTSPRLCSVARVQNLEKTIARFWEIEEGEFKNRYSMEEAECERHYLQHVSRQADGRYLVKLPTKPEILAKLGDSKTAAVRRMHQIERRFFNDLALAAEYRKFMDEYEPLGYMVQVNDDVDPNVPNYYLPHHPVVKPSSSTTKVRVVFDASNKTPGGPSLNDALLVGPTVQSDLRSIVMRSRTHPIILICDVEKMYRQISDAAEDLPLQLILWRKFSDQPLRTYQLTTVTYGTAAAPYLATRTLKQLALDEGSEFPLAAQAVEADCYVDDLITGAKTAVVAREELHVDRTAWHPLGHLFGIEHSDGASDFGSKESDKDLHQDNPQSYRPSASGVQQPEHFRLKISLLPVLFLEHFWAWVQLIAQQKPDINMDIPPLCHCHPESGGFQATDPTKATQPTPVTRGNWAVGSTKLPYQEAKDPTNKVDNNCGKSQATQPITTYRVPLLCRGACGAQALRAPSRVPAKDWHPPRGRPTITANQIHLDLVPEGVI